MVPENYPEFRMFGSHDELERQKKSAWMMTLNDLLSLLLTFFIMLYSLSEYSVGKWQEVSSGVANKFGSRDNFQSPRVRKLDVDYLYQVIEAKINNHPELDKVFIQNLKDRLVISIPMSLLFENNNDELVLGADSILYLLSSTLFELNNQISVNAVTDISLSSPFDNSRKLLLNMVRARNIANLLEENSFIPNIKIFLLNKEYYKIESEEDLISFAKSSDRIDIVINDEEVEKNYSYDVK